MKSLETLSPKPDIGIIICTYNPDTKAFSRVLNAILALIIPDNLNVECVIVDNNSTPEVKEMEYVKNFLANFGSAGAKVITEAKQGSSFARIAGLKSTKAPILIFIDDDNEPDINYVKNAKHYYDNYPSVYMWGPGKITVEYLEAVPEWFAKNCSKFFLEKNSHYIEYGCIVEKWMDCYPYTAGLVLRREVFEKYSQRFQNGELTSTGRKGGSLSSGEDLQLVWEAVKTGSAAGVSPEFQINHLIPARRANLSYVRRLSFGTSSSFAPAITQSFPSTKDLYSTPSVMRILYQVTKVITLRFLHNEKDLKLKLNLLLVDFAGYLGYLAGIQTATNTKHLQWVFKLAKLLRLL